MTIPALPPLRYLRAADVAALMPALPARLELAERVLVGLAEGAELPPKVGLHPRQEGSFAHAMPALLRGVADDGRDDLVGMKWITGFADNVRQGLPALHALVVVNDPRTGVPTAILDGGPITAARTAAVSGVAVARWGPGSGPPRAPAQPPVGSRPGSGRGARAAIIGAGVQGRAHAAMLGHVLPGVDLAIHDRDEGRARALADEAGAMPGVRAARSVADARDAVGGADVVVTCVSFGPVRQAMTPDWFRSDALVIAVDYATSVAAGVAREAALFLVDEEGQFRANRDAGLFDGYPDPIATLGDALRESTPRPGGGRVVITHLGTGLADVVFADAILAAADAAGVGTLLPR